MPVAIADDRCTFGSAITYGVGEVDTLQESFYLLVQGSTTNDYLVHVATKGLQHFLTDHLAGDRYFRTEYPGQNLDRAREQLALFQDMTRKMETMEEIVWICAEGKYRN